MFYIYTVVLPLAIFVIFCFVKRPNPKSAWALVGIVWRFVPYYLAYGMLIYFAELKNLPDTGWAFYTVLFYFILVIVVNTVATLLLFLFKQKSKNR